MCLQRAFLFEQSREQYLDVLRANAREPPSPLLHLCQEHIFSPTFGVLLLSFSAGRTEVHPLNQQASICAGTRKGGRCLGHTQVLWSLQYGFNVIPPIMESQ